MVAKHWWSCLWELTTLTYRWHLDLTPLHGSPSMAAAARSKNRWYSTMDASAGPPGAPRSTPLEGSQGIFGAPHVSSPILFNCPRSVPIAHFYMDCSWLCSVTGVSSLDVTECGLIWQVVLPISKLQLMDNSLTVYVHIFKKTYWIAQS